MLFADVQSSLVSVLRTRVRNGEITERGLARVVGVSQPHIHNVLKGARSLSPELSDQILQHLRLSLLDLIEREHIEAHLSYAGSMSGYVYVPVLKGSIGPGCAWPTEMTHSERLPFPASQVAAIPNPVAVRLAEDGRMALAFSAGDIALLDQSHKARCDIDPLGHYIVKFGNSGVVRRVEVSGNSLYIIAEDCQNRPAAWQIIETEGRQLTNYIRARAFIATPLYEWSTS